MKHKGFFSVIVLTAGMLLLVPLAGADRSWKGQMGVRTPRISSPSGPNLSGILRNRGGSGHGSNLSSGLNQLWGRGSHGAWSGNTGSWNHSNTENLFRSLGNNLPYNYNGFNRHYRDQYYHENNSMAKAYRDVGMANALVGLLGVMVTAAQNSNCATVAPVSNGHWERQAVVVQPERYEQYQEWIPELYDSRSGQKVGGGFYETRTRRVPETIQYRDVWVTP
jgi:hypothetical protein